MSFQRELKGKRLYLKCQQDLTGPLVEELSKAILGEMSSANPDSFVLDFKGCTDIDPSFFRAMALVGKETKALGKPLYAINVASQIGTAIRANGLDLTLKVLQNESELGPETTKAAAASPQPLRIDVDFINPFVNGTLMTLKVQCLLDSRIGKPFVKGKGPAIETDLAAVIGLTSAKFNGTIAICFPTRVFLTLMGNMLGDKFDAITKDLEDGAAELLNIIFGQAKRILNESGHKIEKAIPTIVRGNALAVKHLTRSATIVLPFETDVGTFHIEIATEESTT